MNEFLQRCFAPIVAVNRKYAKPRVKTNAAVRFALLALRLYLLLLVGLMVYKFITLLK